MNPSQQPFSPLVDKTRARRKEAGSRPVPDPKHVEKVLDELPKASSAAVNIKAPIHRAHISTLAKEFAQLRLTPQERATVEQLGAAYAEIHAQLEQMSPEQLRQKRLDAETAYQDDPSVEKFAALHDATHLDAHAIERQALALKRRQERLEQKELPAAYIQILARLAPSLENIAKEIEHAERDTARKLGIPWTESENVLAVHFLLGGFRSNLASLRSGQLTIAPAEFLSMFA